MMQSINLISTIFCFAALGVCSIAAVAVVIERALRLSRRRLIDPAAVEDIQRLIEQGHMDRACDLYRNHPSLAARILSRGLEEHHHTRADIETAMVEAGERGLQVLQNNVAVLVLCAKVAPLLGLFGTVIGMIMGFEELEHAGFGKEQLANAIRVALLTTAVGLAIAIPCVVALAWVRSKIRRLQAEFEEIFIDVIKTVKMAQKSPRNDGTVPAAQEVAS